MTRNVYIAREYESTLDKIERFAKKESLSFSEAILLLAEKGLKK